MAAKGGDNKKAEFTFCRVCRLNHSHGFKHKFHAKHKSTLGSMLTSEASKIAEFKSFASQRLTGGLFASQRWCVFCDKDTSTKDTAFLSTLQHLCSSEHKRNVIAFLKEMGSNENRNKFYVQKGLLKQFVNGEHENGYNDTSSSVSTPSSPGADGATIDKKEDNETKTPKTVVSVNGIRQNPTGWDNGERVWGGGIVKYKREGEWQPWPIDLDNETDAFDPSTLMGGTIIPGLLNTVSPQNNIVASAGVGSSLSSNGVFTHPSLATAPERKITEYAYSSELARVDVAPLPTGQGNVHSGATPPWMVDDSGGTIPTITPFASLSERERRGKKDRDSRKNSKKIVPQAGATKHADSPGWLPNFGSVWTAGPRSETQRNFKLKKQEPKPNARGAAFTDAPVDIGAKIVNKRKLQEM